MAATKFIQGSGLNDETENEFYRKFNFELNGKCGEKKLDCHFKRRKDIAHLHPNTSYLIVRAPFKRSEKILTALAKGIWILHESFIRKIINEERWLDPKAFDVGNAPNPQSELHFSFIAHRNVVRNGGGLFRTECAVVLLEDHHLKEKYKRILAAGGAQVLSRTVQHLVDRPDKELTLIVTEPTIMLDSKFQEFYNKNVTRNDNLAVVSSVYVEECLTSASKPDKSSFEVLKDSVIKLHEEHNIVHKEMLVHDTRRSGSPDIFIDPRHARHRLQIQSRHQVLKESLPGCGENEAVPRKRNAQSWRHPSHESRTIPNSSINGHFRNDNSRNASPQNFENVHAPTPPTSSDNSQFEENLREIIIDLDDEIEEDERNSNLNGGHSPTYAPNSTLKVSEEDQQMFFGKRAKPSKIKTEARKQQDKHYVNQVRLLKEKAEELRRLSAKSSKSESEREPIRRGAANVSFDALQVRQLKEMAVELRRKTPCTVTNKNQTSSPFHENKSSDNHSENHPANRITFLGSNDCNRLAASTSSSNIDQYHNSTSRSSSSNVQDVYSRNQLPQRQEPPKSSFFDNLILNACASVEKRAEKEQQKKKDLNKRLLQSNSLIGGDDLARRVEKFVDKYVGSNSSNSLIASTLANKQNSDIAPIEARNDTIANENPRYRPATPPYQAETPPYQPATPPRLEELELMKANRNVEVVCLSSDEESEDGNTRNKGISRTDEIVIDSEPIRNINHDISSNGNANNLEIIIDDDVTVID